MATASCDHCSSRPADATCAACSRASRAPTRAPTPVLWVTDCQIRNLASPAHPQDMRAEPFSHGAGHPGLEAPLGPFLETASGSVPRSHDPWWVIVVHWGKPSEHVVSRLRPVPAPALAPPSANAAPFPPPAVSQCVPTTLTPILFSVSLYIIGARLSPQRETGAREAEGPREGFCRSDGGFEELFFSVDEGGHI